MERMGGWDTEGKRRRRRRERGGDRIREEGEGGQKEGKGRWW